MLCEELSLRVLTLLKGLIRRHAQKKTKKGTLQYRPTAKIILVFQSRTNSKTAQQNAVKILAAQFRIAYCPS